jgi:hypothetical protein
MFVLPERCYVIFAEATYPAKPIVDLGEGPLKECGKTKNQRFLPFNETYFFCP